MLLLTLSVIGLNFNGFARNIAQDVAVDTARYAALADQDSSVARDRAIRGISLILPRFWAPDVQVLRMSTSSSCVYEATVSIRPLAIGFLLGFGQIRESARAVCELQG
jgi:hypothetical protein